MKEREKPILYLVIPCYNEEQALTITIEAVKTKMNELIKNEQIAVNSKVLLVDDGSTDKTWSLIEEAHHDNLFGGLKLAHNRGHQNALIAGLMNAKEHADITISMDADLQDDINAIDEMVKHYKEGSEIVYGVRDSRAKDSFFKRFTAQLFYKLMRLMGAQVVYNHADFRLMSKPALIALEQYDEVNIFLRGIVPQIGFPNSKVYYNRNKRVAGESKYPLKKMLQFAIDGITSFSVKPLRMITSLGIIMFLISLGVMTYSIIVKLLGSTVSGWTFIVCSIWLVSGIQLLSLGIIGEYIGKIYKETKHRPKYIIEKELD